MARGPGSGIAAPPGRRGAAQALDELASRCWPPLETIDLGGWRARFAEGVTRRANSVLPRHPPADLGQALEVVERLYRARGLVCAFQLSPAARPAGLDTVLATRGYVRQDPTLIKTAPAVDVLAALAGPPALRAVAVASAPSDGWLDLWWSVDGGGGAGGLQTARRIMAGCPAGYAEAWDGQGLVAVGRVALAGPWMGIACLAVRPDARGRGHGSRVLHRLVGWGLGQGARRVFLQVVASNAGARRLYRAAGFRTASRYHYRVRASAPPGHPAAEAVTAP